MIKVDIKSIKVDIKSIKEKISLKKVIRTEILFTPMLIDVPLVIGLSLIWDWYSRGYLMDNSNYTAQLFFGIIIIIGNITFDIPFIKSLVELAKKNKY